jgi:hypothetical protein
LKNKDEKELEKEMMLDKIKIEIMTSLGIPSWIINTGEFSHISSRLCGKIGAEVKKMYSLLKD